MNGGLAGNVYVPVGRRGIGGIRSTDTNARPLHTCARCGVVYDPGQFLDGAPCIDCQESGDIEEPENGWLTPRALKEKQEAEYARKTEGIVRALYDEGYNDGQIAGRIGYSGKWVQAYRAKIGLPIQPQVRMEVYDPIAEDQKLKHKRGIEAYDYSKRRYSGQTTREEHVAWRLANGWPEETAYWQQKSIEEAGL